MESVFLLWQLVDCPLGCALDRECRRHNSVFRHLAMIVLCSHKRSRAYKDRLTLALVTLGFVSYSYNIM